MVLVRDEQGKVYDVPMAELYRWRMSSALGSSQSGGAGPDGWGYPDVRQYPPRPQQQGQAGPDGWGYPGPQQYPRSSGGAGPDGWGYPDVRQYPPST